MSENTGAAALTADPAAAAGAADAGATAAAAAAAGGGAEQGSAAGSSGAGDSGDAWYKGFQDADARGFAELRGWKSPEETVKSFQNLEKLLGQKANAVMIPGDGATPEELSAFYDKLGRPGAADNYPVPEGLKEDPMIKTFAGEAHKLGITSKQFEGVMGFVAAQTQAMQEAQRTERSAAAAAEMDTLKSEMPSLKYDALIENGRRAVRTLGLDGDTVGKLEDALGTRGLIEFMGKIGAGSQEAPFIEGGHAAGGMPSPEAARVELAQLQKDPNFLKAWANGDTDKVARVNKLNAAIAAGAKK